jgi:hypothetical protein
VEHAEAARENGVGIRLDLGGNGRGTIAKSTSSRNCLT